MSRCTTCSTCRQLVARDAVGIRPHLFRGSPCDGGRPAPKPVQAHEKLTRARLTPELREAVAEDQHKAKPYAKCHTLALARERRKREDGARQAKLSKVAAAALEREQRKREWYAAAMEMFDGPIYTASEIATAMAIPLPAARPLSARLAPTARDRFASADEIVQFARDARAGDVAEAAK